MFAKIKVPIVVKTGALATSSEVKSQGPVATLTTMAKVNTANKVRAPLLRSRSRSGCHQDQGPAAAITTGGKVTAGIKGKTPAVNAKVKVPIAAQTKVEKNKLKEAAPADVHPSAEDEVETPTTEAEVPANANKVEALPAATEAVAPAANKVQAPPAATKVVIPAAATNIELPPATNEAKFPAAAKAPPGDMPATPEANTQAAPTEIKTPAEVGVPAPGKVPNAPYKDESPAATPTEDTEDEAKVPTMSEEYENPPTTAEVPDTPTEALQCSNVLVSQRSKAPAVPEFQWSSTTMGHWSAGAVITFTSLVHPEGLSRPVQTPRGECSSVT